MMMIQFLLTDPAYVAFHDEEWGVPVHDDRYPISIPFSSSTLSEETRRTFIFPNNLNTVQEAV